MLGAAASKAAGELFVEKTIDTKETSMRVILLAAMLATASAATAEQNPSAAHIQRTMKMLEDSTAENTERFVSRSRRAIIEPSDWRIAWTLGYRQATLAERFQVTWRSYPLFTCEYEPQPAGRRTLLVQGCANQAHTLTLIPKGGISGISGFVVHAPVSPPAGAGDN